jgi:hypothetical protein
MKGIQQEQLEGVAAAGSAGDQEAAAAADGSAGGKDQDLGVSVGFCTQCTIICSQYVIKRVMVTFCSLWFQGQMR